MPISNLVGKAAEFDRAEEFLDKVVPDTKDMDLVIRIQELVWRVVQGKITAQQLREAAC